MEEKDVKELGFESLEEFFKLISSIDLTKHLLSFKRWQQEDGTKEGLLKLV